jgi:FMN phosphatase YigB (HAD superfamily)
MSIQCVVLDFDGTFTNVELEAAGFESSFARLLGDLIGRTPGHLWDEAKKQVLEGAPELGWEMAGSTTAPADADPYILASTTAQKLLDRLGIALDPGLRSEITQSLYRLAYTHTKTAFRPEAREVLSTILARGLPVHVVTNASTSVVERKLHELAPSGFEKVKILGDARKFLVTAASSQDARFDALATSQQAPALTRPVLLRRGAYFDALKKIWATTHTTPEQTIVCGDIYELDLAMPAALGASVHLIERARTHLYEREAIAALGARGGISADLNGLLARL